MSSEKAISFDATCGATVFSACSTNEVRATSPNVPRCGSPDGP